MEAHFLLTAQSPICLDPSTDVACVNNRLCYNQLKFNCNSVNQYLRRRSHVSRGNKLGTTTGLASAPQDHLKRRYSRRLNRKVSPSLLHIIIIVT